MKILLISPSWVGDAVIAQSLYKRLRENDSSVSLDVLAPSWTLPIISRMPEVSNAILLPFRHGELSLRYRWKFGKGFLNKNYEWVIVLPNSLKSSIVPWATNISKRTGWLGEFRYFFLNDISRLIKRDHPLMVQRFCALANNFEPIGDKFTFPSLKINSGNLELIGKGFALNLNQETLILCPGAEFGPAKRWPAQNYASIANHYLSRNKQIILLGSQKDIQVCKQIESNINPKETEYFFNLCGKTSLEDTVDILSMGLVVSNDSGLMHVAAAVNSKQVALFGPTDPEFTPPLNKNSKIIRKTTGYNKVRQGSGEEGYHPSLQRIFFEEVVDVVDELLNRNQILT